LGFELGGEQIRHAESGASTGSISSGDCTPSST